MSYTALEAGDAGEILHHGLQKDNEGEERVSSEMSENLIDLHLKFSDIHATSFCLTSSTYLKP